MSAIFLGDMNGGTPMSATPATKTVLVVDDDDAVRIAFRLALRDLPYRLLEADNGEKGAEMALAEGVDLVFLDLRMPKLNGVEALRRIRAGKPELTVYIATAFSREFFADLSAVRDEGIEFELLRKPLARAQLIEIITTLLPPQA